MPHPPRLAHLATRTVLVAKLEATYAASHGVDLVEAGIRLARGLQGRVLTDLLDATWAGLRATRKRGSDEDVLELVAEHVKERGLRPAKAAQITAGWSAAMVAIDVQAGTAGEGARRIIESVEGRPRVEAGLAEVGLFLAQELLRK